MHRRGQARVEEQALERTPADASAARIAHTPRELHADEVLEDAVRVLSLSDDPAIPVMEPGGRHVVGWLTHRDILRTYHSERQRLSMGIAPTATEA